MTRRPLITLAVAASATLASASAVGAAGSAGHATAAGAATTTPIKHLVVIFQENVTFDHYFGAYPNAANTDGRPFTAKAGTPTVNGLSTALLVANPNGVNPQRLGPAAALTCDQNHEYTAEQQAADKSLMDKFRSGTNIGDELNAKHITWGWFQGGFASTANVGGIAVCGSTHTNIGGATVPDYSAHHEPFQYYASTANPAHLPPATESEIGHNGQANHQYDLSNFYTTLTGGNMPSVSFLKAAKYQDGHAGYSDPLDEQHFLVSTINAIERSPYWKSTAIVIAYDDSDGWYDHVTPPIINPSFSTEDAYTATGQCGNGTPLAGFQDRCGYGQRLPLLVISPYARQNSVDNSMTDQTSILRFIEDNWSVPRIGGGSFDALAGSLNGLFDYMHRNATPLILNPATGEPAD